MAFVNMRVVSKIARLHKTFPTVFTTNIGLLSSENMTMLIKLLQEVKNFHNFLTSVNMRVDSTTTRLHKTLLMILIFLSGTTEKNIRGM